MLKTKHSLLALTAVFAATSAHATIIAIPDFSQSPDGSTTTFVQDTATSPAVLPTGGTSQAYYVTTFNFGTGSDVHLRANFAPSVGHAGQRLGVEVNDDGLFTTFGGGGGGSLDLAQDMAGLFATVLVKFDYDVARASGNDTLMSVWVNPTSSSTEGSPDFVSNLWNSAGFGAFRQQILNQSTSGAAGDSSITGTQIFTNATTSDATFANALAAATIPEPSTALLGLLGAMALLRRRRN